LDENESYYAIVKYVDVLERTSFSDVLMISTGNAYPEKPVISSNSEVQLNKITIRWNSAKIKDFLKYELYTSTLQNFPLTPINLSRTITTVNDTSVSYDNLKPNTSYYFRLRLYDRGNLYTDSDEKTLTTGNDIPTAVILADAYNVTDTSADLQWSKNSDEDFSRYEIHSSNNPNFTITSQTLLKIVTDQNSTSATLNGLLSSRTYYFKIRVVDKGGLYNDSNEKSALTLAPSGADVPKAVTLDPPSEITQTTMRLTWSVYQGTDFDHYELHYSTEQNFILTSSNIFLGALTTQTLKSMVINSLRSGTAYYFRVRIVNNKGKFSDSQETSASTLP
jgi:predicted phage tail protein